MNILKIAFEKNKETELKSYLKENRITQLHVHLQFLQ